MLQADELIPCVVILSILFETSMPISISPATGKTNPRKSPEQYHPKGLDDRFHLSYSYYHISSRFPGLNAAPAAPHTANSATRSTRGYSLETRVVIVMNAVFQLPNS